MSCAFSCIFMRMYVVTSWYFHKSSHCICVYYWLDVCLPFLPGWISVHCGLCCCYRREYSHRHCKLRISEDQIASKMLDMQLDSPEMKEVPIEFNDVRARPCNSAPCAVSTALRNCMSKFRRRQPIATRCSKVPASGLSQPAAAADQSTVEEMPTAWWAGWIFGFCCYLYWVYLNYAWCRGQSSLSFI